MFRSRQDSEQRKIRLPKRNAPPTAEYLQFVFNQAFQYRGQEVELVWSEPTTTKQFSLVAKAEQGKNHARWTLLEDNGRESRLVWSYDTHDFEVINNMLSMLETSTGEFSTTATAKPKIQPTQTPISPYRKLFAESYTGISSSTSSSLKDSLTRIPRIYQNPEETLSPNTLASAVPFDSSYKDNKSTQSGLPSLSSSPTDHQVLSLSADTNEQYKLLQRAGLTAEALIVKKQDNLGSNELKLLLTKNCEGDVSAQVLLYQQLHGKFTLSRFLTEHPMHESFWVPILFNYLVNELIAIEPPISVNGQALNFLQEAKTSVQALHKHFIRPETGILSYPALLYFLQYEYLRFQVYDYPLSLIIFELNKRSVNLTGGLDLINRDETSIALSRIAAQNRPLDQLAHFETLDYAILLPNTAANTALQITGQIVESLTGTPLSAELDNKTLKLSFGMANIPGHAKDVESIIRLAKQALQKAKSSDLTIAQAEKI